jgi:TolB protein
MNADGSNPLRLTSDVDEDSEPAWLGDGSRIVFFSTRSGNEDIWSMDPDGSDLLNLTDDPYFDSAPATVPGSFGAPMRISFVSDRAGGNLDIYTMAADGPDLTRVTTEPADDFDSSWTHDGTMLIFDTYRNGNWDIYSIEPEGTNTIRLTSHAADDESPAWRP